jgi:hypothetical protein
VMSSRATDTVRSKLKCPASSRITLPAAAPSIRPCSVAALVPAATTISGAAKFVAALGEKSDVGLIWIKAELRYTGRFVILWTGDLAAERTGKVDEPVMERPFDLVDLAAVTAGSTAQDFRDSASVVFWYDENVPKPEGTGR